MNETIRTITEHRSIRKYTDREVEDAKLDAIISAAQAMPTSINGQQLSVIVVKDAQRRQKLSEYATGNPWIAQAPVFLVFVADFNKTEKGIASRGVKQVIHASAEGLVVASFDAGLAMGAAIVAAESLGLGIVPIGSVRRNPQEIIDLLQLPANTFPLVGLCVGYPADASAKKPRMPREAFAHPEHYDEDAVAKAIPAYDQTMAEYYEKRGDKSTTWTESMAYAYKQVYYPNVAPTLKKQGFTLDQE